MNAVLETIEQRYSCRAFTGEPVAADALDAIVKAGLQAPSARNSQPWRLVVVEDKALIEALDDAGMAVLRATDPKSYERMQGRGGKLLYGAPALIVVLKATGEAKYSPDLDAGIVVGTLALAAKSLGLDSCIVAMLRMALMGENGEALKARLGFPEGFDFAISILIGKAAGEPKPAHEIDPAKVIRP
jgi:nitroreductase